MPSIQAIQQPKQNHLLAALPAAEYQRIAPHLELVSMPLAEVLYESARLFAEIGVPMSEPIG